MNAADLGFEAATGAILTRPILWAAPRFGRMGRAASFLSLVSMVIILSQTWNIVRMLSFPQFFPGAYIWNQFGGWAFSALLIFALWTALFYSVRSYNLAATQRELANQERFRRVNAEKLTSIAQLKMLRYQINPHFIFNTLNSVNALIATGRQKDARAMVDGLSDLLRLTLVLDPPLIIPLAEEIDTIRRYLSVEKLRFGERLTAHFEIDDSLNETSVPSLILQPLVENAVRHGVEAQIEPCDILVRASKSGDFMEIVIADSGPGLLTRDTARHREGLGLENVRSRLESVFGGHASLAISNHQGNGFQVAITIPLKIHETLQ